MATFKVSRPVRCFGGGVYSLLLVGECVGGQGAPCRQQVARWRLTRRERLDRVALRPGCGTEHDTTARAPARWQHKRWGCHNEGLQEGRKPTLTTPHDVSLPLLPLTLTGVLCCSCMCALNMRMDPLSNPRWMTSWSSYGAPARGFRARQTAWCGHARWGERTHTCTSTAPRCRSCCR